MLSPPLATPRSAAIQVLRALETASETCDGRPGVIFKEEDWSARERL